MNMMVSRREIGTLGHKDHKQRAFSGHCETSWRFIDSSSEHWHESTNTSIVDNVTMLKTVNPHDSTTNRDFVEIEINVCER